MVSQWTLENLYAAKARTTDATPQTIRVARSPMILRMIRVRAISQNHQGVRQVHQASNNAHSPKRPDMKGSPSADLSTAASPTEVAARTTQMRSKPK